MVSGQLVSGQALWSVTVVSRSVTDNGQLVSRCGRGLTFSFSKFVATCINGQSWIEREPPALLQHCSRQPQPDRF